MMNAMRDMMAEFTRSDGRSESGSAEGSAAVVQVPRGAVPTAVKETPAAAVGMARDIEAEQETNLREGASQKLGATGRGRSALRVEVGPPSGQPDHNLGGLDNRVHSLAVSRVVDLICLSCAIWRLNILLCHRLEG